MIEVFEVDCVVKIIGLAISYGNTSCANIKGSTVVLVILFSSDFMTTVVRNA